MKVDQIKLIFGDFCKVSPSFKKPSIESLLGDIQRSLEFGSLKFYNSHQVIVPRLVGDTATKTLNLRFLNQIASELPFAEDEGFEPSIGFPIHAFQACALGRYANPPRITG